MKHSLKLLFVLPAYEPAWAFGGVVRCMSNLCRGLAALGHKVTVYTINSDGHGNNLELPGDPPFEQGGVSTYFFPSTFGPGSVFDSRALVNQLRHTVHDFDLVYVSAIWQWLGLSVAAICAKKQVPLVIGTHGSFDQSNRQKGRLKKMLFWHLFVKKSFARASALHFTTQHEFRESVDLLAAFKSFFVPNSLDCNYFRPIKDYRDHFRQRFGIPSSVPLLITVGRADPTKRYDLLIRALALLPDLHMLIVGPEKGDLMLKWQNLARELQVSERTIWAGHLANEELLWAYGAADIFSLISNSENFGMVVAEAMACGLPIVINPEVGVSEMLTPAGGIMIVEKTSQAIAEALRNFLQHRELWEAWSDHNVRVAHALFGEEKVAALMVQALEDLLTGNRNEACKWHIPGDFS
jgi:glycosyltransferase involved in cell wall biosynthesis